jgi:hypothetical protein
MESMEKALLIPWPKRFEVVSGIYELPDSGEGLGDVATFLGMEGLPTDLDAFSGNAEGYALAVTPDGIRIWASTETGHFYACMTLKQLHRQFGSHLPCVRISDWPSLAHRGIQIPLCQGQTAFRASYFHALVEVLAEWKINALYLYLEYNFQFSTIPHLGQPQDISPKEARALEAHCRAHHMQLIPQVNLLGHSGDLLSTQRYQHLMEHAPGNDIRGTVGTAVCASSPEVRSLVGKQLHDLMACFSSNILHVGGDEVRDLGLCEDCAPKVAETGRIGLYVDYFLGLGKLAEGRTLGIWGDMLLAYFRKLDEEGRRAVAERLRDRVIVYDWCYLGGSKSTLSMFRELGFKTIACASTNLCFAHTVDLSQMDKHRALYHDALDTGCFGGLTTAWMNAYGLHEEHMSILQASSGMLLWSGRDAGELMPSANNPLFESAFCLHRYGRHDNLLTEYWHVLGDETGKVNRALGECNGINLRKCLYHTDNPLTMWRHYHAVLTPDVLSSYEAGIREARGLWERMCEGATRADPLFLLQEGPLLTHEHLLRRYRMTEVVYALFDEAAQVQFQDPVRFRTLLDEASNLLEAHLKDFPPVESYLHEMHRRTGLELTSLFRLRKTKEHLLRLADFLRTFPWETRMLPKFVLLHDVYFETFQSYWFLDRQPDWCNAPEAHRRYSVQSARWTDTSFERLPEELQKEETT